MDTTKVEPRPPVLVTSMSRGRRVYGLNLLRDQLSLGNWILLGALLQGLAMCLLPVRPDYVLAPVLALAVYKVLGHVRAVSTYRPGHEGAILYKNTARLGDTDEGVCILLLGFRNYQWVSFIWGPVQQVLFVTRTPLRQYNPPRQPPDSPLGLLAPGATEIGEYAQRMNQDLHKNAADYGFLGATPLLGGGAVSGNEVIQVYYFKSKEHLHRWAHSESHRDGWKWWNATVAKHPHLGIFHETYHAPPGCHESVYMNGLPTGLGATSVASVDEEGNPIWKSPIVRADRSRFRTMLERMSRTDGSDNVDFEGEL